MKKNAATGLAVLLAGCGEAPPQPEPREARAPAATPAPASAAAPTPTITAQDGQNYALDPNGPLRIVGSETQYDIVLPTDVLFDFDRAELRAEAEPLLTKVKAHLDANGADQLHVKGHTDSKGDDQYNFRLSMRRAAAVCDWLKARGQRFTNCIGRGEQEPVAPNAGPDGSDDPLGRQLNRRVAVSVVKYPDVNAMMRRAREQARDGMKELQPGSIDR